MLPSHLCFRITRSCNARCTFCLAPPYGAHPEEAVLRRRLDWLLERGVRGVQFCGGEPTIHPAFPQLLAYAHSLGARTSLCTNALDIPGALLPLLCSTGTLVRVSVHGDPSYHDSLVGAGCFQRTAANLRRLRRATVSTALQTTVMAGGTDQLVWIISFALEQGVRRLSVIPFLPRGRGAEHRAQLALSQKDRHTLAELVRWKRRELSGRLDLRYLDLTTKKIAVVEADGTVVREGASEALDEIICRIP